MEVLSGIIATAFGLKRTLCLAFVLRLCSLFLFLLYTHDYTALCVSYTLDGVIYALISGTIEAYIAKYGDAFNLNIRDLFASQRFLRNASKIIASAMAAIALKIFPLHYLQNMEILTCIIVLIITFSLPEVEPSNSKEDLISWDPQVWVALVEFMAWCVTNMLFMFFLTEVALHEQGYQPSFWAASCGVLLFFKTIASKLPKYLTPVESLFPIWLFYTLAIYLQSSLLLALCLFAFFYVQLHASIDLSVRLKDLLKGKSLASMFSAGSLLTSAVFSLCTWICSRLNLNIAQQSFVCGFIVCFSFLSSRIFVTFVGRTNLSKDREKLS